MSRDPSASPEGASEYAVAQQLSEGSPGGDTHVTAADLHDADGHDADDDAAAAAAAAAAGDGDDADEEASDDQQQPQRTAEEQHAHDLELQVANVELRLARREAECDTLRAAAAAADARAADAAAAAERLLSERDALAGQVEAGEGSVGELQAQVAELEKRVAAKEKKGGEKKGSVVAGKETERKVARLEEALAKCKAEAAASAAAAAKGGGIASASVTEMGVELRKAHDEIAQLRAAAAEAAAGAAAAGGLVAPHSSKQSHRQPQLNAAETSSRIPSSSHGSVSPPPQHPAVGGGGDEALYLPGERILAWWEPGSDSSPRGWANDAPGWYPCVVLPFQSATHCLVDFGNGRAPFTVPRCNTRTAGPLASPREAARLAHQVLEKNPWMSRTQPSPQRAAAAAVHLLQSEGIAGAARQSSLPQPPLLPPPPQASPSPSAADRDVVRRAASSTPFHTVSTPQEAERLAKELVQHKGVAARTSASTAYTVIGQLTPTEAAEAARRILDWELSGNGPRHRQASASPRAAVGAASPPAGVGGATGGAYSYSRGKSHASTSQSPRPYGLR